MAPEIDQFWKLLAASQLLGAARLEEARSAMADLDTQATADRLVEQKLLTSLQREVLLAGHAGPFVYGRYVIGHKLDSADATSGFQAFAAADRTTGYPVKLDFYDGKHPNALGVWKGLERQIQSLKEVSHPNLLSVFQTIALPAQRFVVSELPAGKQLAKAVPPKGRLKFSEAVRIAKNLSESLEAIESVTDTNPQTQPRGTDEPVEGRPTVESLMKQIWIGADRAVKIAPLGLIGLVELPERQQIFLLSALILRLGTGRSLAFQWNEEKDGFDFDVNERDKRIAAIEKAAPLKSLLQKGLATADQDDAVTQRKTFQQALKKMLPSDVSEPNADANQSKDPKLARRAAYQASISGLALPAPLAVVGTVPEIDVSAVGQYDQPVSSDVRVAAAQEAAIKRKQARWKMPAAVVGGMMAIGLLLGILAIRANSRSIAVVKERAKKPAATEGAALKLPETVAAPETDYSNVAYVQEVIEDDAQTLWESPTTGLPIALTHLPSETEIILHMRMGELLAANQGSGLLQSLGPDWEAQRQSLEKRTGVPLEKISELTVAMFPDASTGYQSMVSVVLDADAVDRQELINSWGQPDEVQLAGGQTAYAGDQDAWMFLETEKADQLRFIVAAPKMLQEISNQQGAFVLPDALTNVLRQTDRDQQVTLLALAKSLTNENARTLLGDWNARLMPSLRLLIPDQVRAIGLSMFVDPNDGAEYLELQVDHSADIATDELLLKLKKTMATTTDSASAWTGRLASIPYWDKLKLRFGKMLGLLNRQTRWGAEFEQVRGNAWLPAGAVQNLLAASELSLTFADAVAVAQTGTDSVGENPQTFEELLAAKRSLNVSNPPDLNVLLSDIRLEILDDFPSLPFDFKIKLMGTDLRTEGITQNQRPGPLKIDQQPLSAILTTIMTSANPDKSISGPADPNCKLVWVVAEDPDDPSQQAVLITTRAAAKEKGYSLPTPFVEK